MSQFKRITGFSLAPLFIGVIGPFNLMGKPRFAAIHTVDVVQLLVSGACFGVALAGLIMVFRRPRAS